MESYIDSRGAEMAPMSWTEALEIIHSLADDNVLTDEQAEGSDVLENESARQRQAVDLLHDFVVNHEDRIDELAPSEKASDWPDQVWRAAPGMQPDGMGNALRISLELAIQNAIDPDDAGRDVVLADECDRQQQAIDMTKDLLGLHGSRIDEITFVSLLGKF